MYKICVFAGTTEGRELVEFLVTQPVAVTACVATEYGEALLEPCENLNISAGRLTENDMETLFSREKFDLVIDATHPYAPIVTENLVSACSAAGTEYLRLLREEKSVPEGSIFVENMEQAVEFLNKTQGNILLTTGSKELSACTGIADFPQRAYARVLPMEDSLRLCREAGLTPSHILAMQGPFSLEMNIAMLRAVSARYLLTKESGAKGGFDQKIAAARAANVRLVVIGRPPQQEGLSFAGVMAFLGRRFGLRRRPRVLIAGIGPGSRKAMTGEVLDAIACADCLLGAGRMLEAAACPGKAVHAAVLPGEIAGFIHDNPQYSRFTVLMSGDTGFFSGTKKLLPLLSDCDVTVLPGISSLVYLCGRLKTSYEDVVPVSLHGRDQDIVGALRRHHRIFVLVGGENGMGKLCRRLTEAGLGQVRVSAGQNLSYETEVITRGAAAELAEQTFHSLCAALLESDEPEAVVTPGLPDSIFQRGKGPDGVVPMTKSEVRALCLSRLRLTESAVCWDVGAGTGSVAIEMGLQAIHGQVFAIEKKEAALDLLAENCRKLRAGNVTVVPGAAPDACRDLPAPTHVFLGGTGGNVKEILRLVLEKNPGARIVATAIALETLAQLTQCLEEFPFAEKEVLQLTVAKDRKAGPYHLMTGQNPIYIFTMQAGGNDA